jgi:hypothetical protein
MRGAEGASPPVSTNRYAGLVERQGLGGGDQRLLQLELVDRALGNQQARRAQRS